MHVRRDRKAKSKLSNKPAAQLRNEDQSELTRSPISGTYILPYFSRKKTNTFSKSEAELSSLAAAFVNDTPQLREQLARIPNLVGAFECKLCRTVYRDAIELAIHNCPRMVSLEYRYFRIA